MFTKLEIRFRGRLRKIISYSQLRWSLTQKKISWKIMVKCRWFLWRMKFKALGGHFRFKEKTDFEECRLGLKKHQFALINQVEHIFMWSLWQKYIVESSRPTCFIDSTLLPRMTRPSIWRSLTYFTALATGLLWSDVFKSNLQLCIPEGMQ